MSYLSIKGNLFGSLRCLEITVERNAYLSVKLADFTKCLDTKNVPTSICSSKVIVGWTENNFTFSLNGSLDVGN